MPRELGDLGRPVRLRPARRWPRLVPLVAGVVVVAAVAARAADEQDLALDELVGGSAPVIPADATSTADGAASATADGSVAAVESAVELPVLGRAGGVLLHVPAELAILVSYHEASFPQALPIQPLGELTGNDNSTRRLDHAPHPEGIAFHVQVSRGRANASTSAVDVVVPHGEEVRAPVSGTVVDVRPYRLYGSHDDVRLELRPDDSDLAVVLIHVEDVIVRSGDRVEIGDVLAGAARLFPFGAVVDQQTEPDRYGHVHMEVKTPE